MSTINYTYNVIVDRFRQFAAGHFQLRRFTHGEISQADLEKEAEWPWLHVKPRAINYSPGTRSFQFEIFISDLPRDKEDKTGYQAESITDCSLIFQDLINEIYLGNMFGTDALLTRPVNSEPFVEQYTHTLTGVTGTIELQLDYDWSACSIPASWNYNTPTDSGSDGWGALQFIESLDQNGVYVSLLNDEEAPGNSYYYGTNASGVKGWYASTAGLTCEDLPECATIISIVDDIEALQTDKVDKVAGKGLSTEDYTTAEKNKLAGIQAGAEVNVNADWNATSGDAQILNKPTLTNGTVTSVAALTLGTTGSDLSSTVANGTSTPVITLNVPTASATNRGALSSTDWNTFNNKQNALGYTPLAGVHSIVPMASGDVTYNGLAASTSASNQTGLSVRVAPYIPSQSITTSNLFISVTTATAGSLCTIVIYSDLNGLPNTRLFESADLDCSTLGLKTATTSFSFVAGTRYWLGLKTNGTAASRLHLTSISSPTLSMVGSAANIAFQRSGITYASPAPSPFGTPSLTTSPGCALYITKA